VRRLEYLPEARADLEDIWRYIAADNPRAATMMVDRIQDRCERLAAAPFTGRARPELGADLRAVVVGSYLAFYRVTSELVEVVRVLHGAQDLPAILRSRSR
jgi:toxin ParE1/3/4